MSNQLYQSGNVTITRQQITVGNSVYAVRNVGAAHVKRVVHSSAVGVLLIVFGAFGIAGGGLAVLIGATMEPVNVSSIVTGAVILALAVLSIVGGALLNRAVKPLFHIFLTTNAGEVRALTTRDEAEATAISGAIYTAIGEVDSH